MQSPTVTSTEMPSTTPAPAGTKPGQTKKPTRRRDPLACVSCRRRKIRCDTIEGFPCWSCRRNNIECIRHPSRNKAKPQSGKPNANGGAKSPHSVTRCQALWPRPPARPLPGRPCPQTTDILFDTSHANALPYNFAQPLLQLGHPSPLSPQPTPAPVIPAFLKPIPPKVDATDTQYLLSKGAFTLPGVEFQNALLKAFIEYVHPFIPVLDLVEFLSIIHNRDGSRGQTSLVLYQAVMFSGSAFVSMEILHDQKDAWHWLGIAISLARCLGMHRDPGTKICPRTRKLWKRIWWSALMRDRLLTLGMRRPTRISEADFDLPMLEETDFEIGAFQSMCESSVLPDCTLLRDAGIQRELAQLCIAKVKLCVYTGHILEAQYALRVRDTVESKGTAESTMMIFPSQTLRTEDIHRGDAELGEWLQSLPVCCQSRPLVAPVLGRGDAKTTVEISTRKTREAARRITQLAAELCRLDLDKLLPASGCRGFIERFRELYVTADFAAMLLDVGLKKFGATSSGSDARGDARTSAAQMPTPEESDAAKEQARTEGQAAGPAPGLRTLSVLDLLPCSPPPVDFASADTTMVEDAGHHGVNSELHIDLENMDLDILGI
ncbi:unnamed protein product [Parascedosporium putredinis]|uniref:Zn(2)-C6 fungal-type domain-containing protein n=1 Tax=Parascedosporium putredinis TaxID=1442378 RepID=A0A9P1MEL0_9PEZI|nr:unnamed protein product [Parascedosporium putredinis]CAI8004832.1 unnamed protein product [Parascedosporium putredinis]